MYKIITFIVIIVIYIHIVQHLKINNILEKKLFNINQITKDRLFKLTMMKTPFIFTFINNEKLLELITPEQIINLDVYKIMSSNNIDSTNLFNNIKTSSDIITLNMRETDDIIYKKMIINSFNITPILSSQHILDIIITQNKKVIPFTQNYAHTHFITCISNNINITLIPPSYASYINYDVHINNSSISTKNTNIKITDDIQYIDINLLKFNTIYIPPFWSYKISTPDSVDHKNTIILSSSYNNPITIFTNFFINIKQKL
jgi:hypothetical protein